MCTQSMLMWARLCVRVCCNCAQFKSDFVFRLRTCVVVAMRTNRYSIIPLHTHLNIRASKCATHKSIADTSLIFRNAVHSLMWSHTYNRIPLLVFITKCKVAFFYDYTIYHCCSLEFHVFSPRTQTQNCCYNLKSIIILWSNAIKCTFN